MMRGLQTTVKNIRRRVFTEVAKLGFKADADTLLDDMEAIPYEIVNDDTQKYRESTYRSRAIVRERLRLAMGLSLRPENKPVHLTAGVEASNISEKYYEPPLMQVIPSACESCEENKYEVSNMCKGCLAHPCQEVCPRGAISMVNGKSFIDQEKCIKCGKCKSVCPYDAIAKKERPCQKACGVNAIVSDKYGRARSRRLSSDSSDRTSLRGTSKRHWESLASQRCMRLRSARTSAPLRRRITMWTRL